MWLIRVYGTAGPCLDVDPGHDVCVLMRKSNRSPVSRLRKLSQRVVATLLLLGFGYAVTPVLISSVNPAECDVWSKRFVAVGDLDGTDLIRLRRDVRVVRVPSYMAAWPRDGIAFPGVVAIPDERMLDDHDTLLWHEMVHQHQYRRDGSVSFLVRYITDWHLGLLAGCAHDAAYEAIGYEIETAILLRNMRVSLGGAHSEEYERVALLLEDPSLYIPRVPPRLYSKPVTSIPSVRGNYQVPFPLVTPPRFPRPPVNSTEVDPSRIVQVP